MELKGSITEHGTTKKEKKDDTEYIHHLKVAEKGDFKLSIASWDKELMGKIKQDGMFNFSTEDTEITITVQCKVKKEKYDKEDENLIKNTGNPWFTFKKVISNENWTDEIMHTIGELHEVKFV